jgi:hypothetical protein
LHRVAGSGRDLELDGSLGLVLHDDSPRGDLVAVAVPDLERNEVAPAKLAVGAKVKEGELDVLGSRSEDEREEPRCS